MSAAPLNPIEFQAELEKRGQEEKEKMEQFKQYEERMKAYQQQKRTGNSKPPMMPSKENVPVQVYASAKGNPKIPKVRAEAGSKI